MNSLSALKAWLLAMVVPLVATVVGFGIENFIHKANISLAYLVGVLIVSLRTGTTPALGCALVSFLFYNFFFTEPRLTLMMTHREDMLTVGLFLMAAAIAGQQAVRLKKQFSTLQDLTRSQRTQFRLSQALVTARDEGQIHEALKQAVAELMETGAFVVPRDDYSRGIDSTVAPAGLDTSLHLVFAKGQRDLSGPLLFPLADGDGSVVAVLGVNSREPDHHMVEIIEGLVQQACVALGRTKLEQEVQRERLDKEREMLRSALLSSVSHDLRTPLASMIGSASSLLDLRESLSDEQQRELLEAILQEASRLDNYTRNLLDMTRLEYGELPLDRDWVGLDEILSVVLRRIKGVLGARKLTTRIERNLPPFYVHGNLIEQAIFNILDNAVKFSPDGSEIRISVARQEDGVTIDISDRGVGVPFDERQHIFDMFHSVNRGDHHSAGTGLGLSIAKGMVGAHGGNVELLDTGPGGTTFRITLPLSDQPVDEEHPV